MIGQVAETQQGRWLSGMGREEGGGEVVWDGYLIILSYAAMFQAEYRHLARRHDGIAE